MPVGVWILPKLQESAKIERKVIKTHKGTLISAKNIKVTETIFFSEKTPCQKLVAMITSKSINTNRPHRIFSR